jgi:hypothetical protein
VRRRRGLLALVCIVVLLATAMAPIGSGAFCAVLVPLTPLFGAVVVAPLPPAEPARLPAFLVVTPLAPRAPPAA